MPEMREGLQCPGYRVPGDGLYDADALPLLRDVESQGRSGEPVGVQKYEITLIPHYRVNDIGRKKGNVDIFGW